MGLWGHTVCVVYPHFLVWKIFFSFSLHIFCTSLTKIDKQFKKNSKLRICIYLTWFGDKSDCDIYTRRGKGDITTLRLLDEGSERHWGQNKGRTLRGAPLHTPSECCYHLLHLNKDEMCSPVVPHNDKKGYGWWSRAAWILKTLWCKSPTDSTRKVVSLLLFCIMFLTVRSMSQSSLHQNIIYIYSFITLMDLSLPPCRSSLTAQGKVFLLFLPFTVNVRYNTHLCTCTEVEDAVGLNPV